MCFTCLHNIQMGNGACGRIRDGKTMRSMNFSAVHLLRTIFVWEKAHAANFRGNAKRNQTLIYYYFAENIFGNTRLLLVSDTETKFTGVRWTSPDFTEACSQFTKT